MTTDYDEDEDVDGDDYDEWDTNHGDDFGYSRWYLEQGTSGTPPPP